MRLRRNVLRILFTLTFTCTAFNLFAGEQGIPYQNEWLKEHYQSRMALFDTQPIKTGDVVFIGDSLTELGANWSIRFDNLKVRNRGISGDTTYGVLERLQEIENNSPAVVFLLIGINDIFNLYYEREIQNLSNTALNIRQIVSKINASLPNTKIFVLGLLPDHRDYITVMAKEVNRQIELSNSDHFTFLNFHDSFSIDGTMNPALTTDGTHLNEAGYQVFKEQLMPYLKNL
ncbi:hypothetical protein J8L84_12305 [Alteromonas sp. MMG017]|uniref:GDSL-type esterase/lipase family protein n=1 Tax=Alteromonas sp. MMG017 TaxID=2822692 RepID=UPI001B39E49B|nr:GDSL-type esterase/lipase family protein [Alteromonas sp. MMG017]MBQ4830061.1 hypothetical protein [Alteromonas sp. MMG017]